jgi:hypothetical protein
LKKEVDLITTHISDLRRTNDEQMKISENQWKLKVEEERLQRIELSK